MIGQNKLKTIIDKQIADKTLPRFIILVGEEGSGRKTISKYIASKLEASLVSVNLSVEAIREMRATANAVFMPTVYMLADADKLSSQAKNALLKVTEEPPQNAYFIMTLKDLNNTLDTIRSRGSIYNMQKYDVVQLLDYCDIVASKPLSEAEHKYIVEVCNTPGDINKLLLNGVSELKDFVKLTFDNIAIVQGANAFKIADKITLKEGSKGFDLTLFLRAFECECREALWHNADISAASCSSAIRITAECRNAQRITGINKQYIFDKWILDIRKVFM